MRCRYYKCRKFAIIGTEAGDETKRETGNETKKIKRFFEKFEIYPCAIGDFEGLHIPKYDEKKIVEAALLSNVGSVLCEREIKGFYNASGKFLAPFFLKDPEIIIPELIITDEDPIYTLLILDCAAGLDVSLITLVATENGTDFSKKADKIFEETGLAVNVTHRRPSGEGVFAESVLEDIIKNKKVLYKDSEIDLKTLDLIFYNYSKPYRNLIEGIYVSAEEIKSELEKLIDG